MRKGLRLALMLSLSCCAAFGGEPSQDGESAKEVDRLRRLVKQLEARIDHLEQRLNQVDHVKAPNVIRWQHAGQQWVPVYPQFPNYSSTPTATPKPTLKWYGPYDPMPNLLPTLLFGGQEVRIDSHGIIQAQDGASIGVWGVDYTPEAQAR